MQEFDQRTTPETPQSPNKLRAEFAGFSQNQEKTVREEIENIGLPLNNIKKVAYAPNQKGEENILGSFQPFSGELTLYKSLENLPLIAQQGTMIHEISHSASPLDPENTKLFKSRDEAKIARKNVIGVARQSVITRKYLNGYQAYLHKQLEAGEIDLGRFVEETHAIMMELRFTNPKHLKEVETAQHKALKKVNINNKDGLAFLPVALLTSEKEAERGNLQGADRTIANLIPNLKTKEDIDKHVSNLRQHLRERQKPILPNHQFQKA